MKRLGLIINPIAGMGGSVGLKGTDGVLEEALQRGAIPKAPGRCGEALMELLPLKEELTVVTCGGIMGGDLARELGFSVEVAYENERIQTQSGDTIKGAEAILKEGIDLLLFAGGDGTARDVCSVVSKGLSGGNDPGDCNDAEYLGSQLMEAVAFVGIPAGVKIHSPVYGQNPRRAGELARLFFEGKASIIKEAEVLDIDEEQYRQGCVSTRLYGYLNVPFERRFLQNRKAPSPQSERTQHFSIANEIIKHMKEDAIYIVGPGSTTRAVMELLELPFTLIGVDIIQNRRLIKQDACERDILDSLDVGSAMMIVTPTGGQGYLLGRGNQQLSPAVIKKLGKENLIVAATREKLASLMGKPLLVDTGDREADQILEGYIKVITGLMEAEIYKIRA